MLGVEHEARVEGAGRHRRRFLSREHVQEVRGEREVRSGLDRLLPRADAVMGADGGRDLARQARGLPAVRGGRIVVGVGVVHAEDGDGGLEHAVGIGLRGHERDGLEQRGRDGPRRDQLDGEPVQLGAGRQLAVPEQIGDLLEGRPARQVRDVVTAVGETAVRPVQIAEPGLGGHDAFEAPDELRSFSHGWLLS